MAEKTWINIGGVNKEAIPWINVNGTWKQCIPWVNVNGVWKKCYDTGTTVYIPASGDSASQSQNRVIQIPNLQSIVSCTVNTGTVSYTVDGTSVQINVNNGSSVRSSTPRMIVNDFRATVMGGDPQTLPSSIYYNSGGYIGTLLGGSAYVEAGSPAGNKYCTGTWGTTYTIVNGNIIGGASAPATIPYSDGEYSGNIDFVNVNQAYLSAWMEFADAYDAGGSWSGYIMFDYGETLYKSDTRFWRKDYSGTVYGPTTYYYAYVVNMKYTIS